MKTSTANEPLGENHSDGILNHAVQGRCFLQSEEWRKFQESVGRKTFSIGSENSSLNIIEHELPMVGKYFYIPRGFSIRELGEKLPEIIMIAEKNSIGWLRIDPMGKGVQELAPAQKIKKAPHDMQPRELFIIDIAKEAEEILSQMKSKTRYNIRLAGKKGVKIFTSKKQQHIDKFCELVEITSKRDGITSHPKNYYEKMLEMIPEDNLKLYLAEYEGKIIAANLIYFYGEMATYLHGSSDNEHRNVMAPHLLQWQAILDAKEHGFTKYDFGGVSTNYESNTNIRITNNWHGITRFKLGFSPDTEVTKFPGSYDIVLNSFKYFLYRFLQKIRSIL